MADPKCKRFNVDWLAQFAPAIFLILWASGFGVGKVGLQYVEPLTFLSLRFGIIVLFFLPAFLIVRPKAPPRRIDWLHLVVVGFLIQSVYFGLAYAGMHLGVSSGAASVIASTQPLIVTLIAPWFTRERNGFLKWIGMLFGALGAIAVVVADSGALGTSANVGLLLCVTSMFGMAGATLYQKRFAVNVHPITVSLVQYAVGLATIAPISFIVETGDVKWSLPLVGSLVWLIVANSLISVSLLLFMIGRNEASKVSALFFLVPPLAAIFGWALLGEPLTPLACAGMVAAVIGVAMVSRTVEQKQ